MTKCGRRRRFEFNFHASRVAHTITESHMKRDNCHFHNPQNVLLVINEEKKDSKHIFQEQNTEEMLLSKPTDLRFDDSVFL